MLMKINQSAIGLTAGRSDGSALRVIGGSNVIPRQYVSGCHSNSVRYSDEYYFLLLLGGHALTSPEGGRPCSLSTFNYGVAGHLAFRFNQRKY